MTQVIDYKHHCLNYQSLSPRTVKNRLAALRGFCAFLVRSGMMRTNPLEGIRTPRIPTDRHAKESLTVEQLEKLLNLVRSQGTPRDQAILNLITYQGLRVVEVSRLNMQDICELDGKHTVMIRGKGHDTQIPQPMQSQVVSSVVGYLNSKKDPSSDALFSTRTGTRLSPDDVSRICKHWLRSAGFDDKRITAHSLRHTFATLVLAQGGRIEIVSKMLRHANLATTMIYAHIDQAAIDSQFAQFGHNLNNGESKYGGKPHAKD